MLDKKSSNYLFLAIAVFFGGWLFWPAPEEPQPAPKTKMPSPQKRVEISLPSPRLDARSKRTRDTSSDLSAIFTQLDELLSRGEFEQARLLLRKQIEAQDAPIDLVVELAVLNAEVFDQSEEAISMLEQAVRKKHNVRSLEVLVDLYSHEERNEEAITFLDGLPKTDAVRAALGDVYLREGNSRAAVQTLEAAPDAAPSLLAAAYSQTGRGEKALSIFKEEYQKEKKLARSNPNRVDQAHYKHLDVIHELMRLGRYNEAGSELSQLLSENPNQPDALELLSALRNRRRGD